MAKWNAPESLSATTVNNCGATAFSMDWRTKLVTQVLTTFMSDNGKFYDNKANNTVIKSIREGIKIDPKFVAKLGMYARTKFNLRSISHVIFAELAHCVKGEQYMKNAIFNGIVRVDDMTEIMAYYMKTYGKPIPNCLKKGLGLACSKFSEYQFAKYNRDGEITLQDLFNLCHPNPLTPKNEQTFKQVIANTLPVPETWETYLSAHGNNKESWEHLIENNSLGYMAMLRNLRNILSAKVSSDHVDSIVVFLTNEQNILNSKQLPFRFWTAYKELSKSDLIQSYDYEKILDALSMALEVSASNIAMIPGHTVIAVDTSGSMRNSISDKSGVTACDIANLMAGICATRCEKATIIHFNTKAKKFNFNKNERILDQIARMSPHGGGTDLHAPIDFMILNNIVADRIIYLSDNELNSNYDNTSYSLYYGSHRVTTTTQQLWNTYKAQFNPAAWLHAIDLAGYGTQQFKGNKENILAGWNDRVFEFIALTEQGFGSIVNEINKIQI